jgi:hypothetical protein
VGNDRGGAGYAAAVTEKYERPFSPVRGGKGFFLFRE